MDHNSLSISIVFGLLWRRQAPGDAVGQGDILAGTMGVFDILGPSSCSAQSQHQEVSCVIGTLNMNLQDDIEDSVDTKT